MAAWPNKKSGSAAAVDNLASRRRQLPEDVAVSAEILPFGERYTRMTGEEMARTVDQVMRFTPRMHDIAARNKRTDAMVQIQEMRNRCWEMRIGSKNTRMVEGNPKEVLFRRLDSIVQYAPSTDRDWIYESAANIIWGASNPTVIQRALHDAMQEVRRARLAASTSGLPVPDPLDFRTEDGLVAAPPHGLLTPQEQNAVQCENIRINRKRQQSQPEPEPQKSPSGFTGDRFRYYQTKNGGKP